LKDPVMRNLFIASLPYIALVGAIHGLIQNLPI
jgi:hypothetical protein